MAIEPGDSGGWSVLVVGRADELTDLDDVARLASLRTVLVAGRGHRAVGADRAVEGDRAPDLRIGAGFTVRIG